MNLPGEGGALLAGGRFHEALAVYSRALQADPGALEPRLGLAQAFFGTGDTLTATAWASDASRVSPQRHEPLQLLADLLMLQKLYAQAAGPFTRLCDQFGQRTRANLLHAGFCLEQLGELERAAAFYREAIALDPDFMEAHVDLAGILWRMEDFAGSLHHAREAVRVSPDHPYAVRMLGTALLNANRLAEAEVQLRRALALQPGFPLAQLDLAFTLLGAGQLAEGWTLYEHRWRDTDRVRRPAFFQPHAEWQGPAVHPLAGKAIAVYAEQGLGDVVQFVRYIPLLQAQGAEVHCVLQPELAALVEHSFPGVRCLPPGATLAVNWHAAIMELPLRFGTTMADIPAQVPYLAPLPADRAAWAARLAPWAEQFKVGFAWSGSLVQVNNRNRAVPLGLLQPLWRQPGVQGFSLQKGSAGAWTDVAVTGEELVDFTADWSDFSASAAMIEQLDLVVTVDTVIAHLAGALGKPVWVLLPPNPDWRWLQGREDSPWYPTAQLFHRGLEEAREAQVERVAAALSELLASR
jgi:tetratricopeptide (TPR) repeat protein